MERLLTKRIFCQVYPLFWLYLVWQLLGVVTGSTASLSVCVSGSMEPQIKRGDILFSIGPDRGDDLRRGDVVLYLLPHRPDMPIVHRIIGVVAPPPGSESSATSEVQYLTKGDANMVDDRGLVSPSFPSGLVPKEAILGKVRGQLPWVGYVTIFMHHFKYMVLAAIAFVVVRGILAKDQPGEQEHQQKPSSLREWGGFLMLPL